MSYSNHNIDLKGDVQPTKRPDGTKILGGQPIYPPTVPIGRKGDYYPSFR